MERENGYLIFKYNCSYKDLINNKIINDLARHRVSFYLTKEKLYFKEEENVYHELIGSKIANYLKIKTVNYDLASIITSDKNMKGVVSSSFLDENYHIVSFASIISDYSKKYNKELQANDMNLEFIWHALEDRYQKHPNSNIIVSNIINQLIDYFLLDLLIGNIDNGKYNYELMENDTDAKCTPYYDFERTFIFKHTRFTIGPNDNNDIYSVIEKFLLEYSPNYINRFLDMYSKLTPLQLEKIFEEVEKDIDYPLPINLKNILFLSYSRHYYKIGDILEKIKINNLSRK